LWHGPPAEQVLYQLSYSPSYAARFYQRLAGVSALRRVIRVTAGEPATVNGRPNLISQQPPELFGS